MTHDQKAIKKWPPLKKALWEVVMSEKINKGYVLAFPFVERLYQAALSTTQEPVGWLYEWPNGRKEFRSSDKPKDFDAWAATITPLYTTPTLTHQPVTAGWEKALADWRNAYEACEDEDGDRRGVLQLKRDAEKALLVALKSEGRK